MTRRSTTLMLSLWLLALPSCTDAEAPARCEAFRDAYCEQQGELCDGVTAEACAEMFDAALDCDEAVGTSGDYDDCLAEVDALEDCPADLPASCGGVIYTPDTEEE